MSLKGYQWLVEDVVVMSYTFKDRVLDVWKETDIGELDKFRRYIESCGCEIIDTNFHNNKVNGYH